MARWTTTRCSSCSMSVGAADRETIMTAVIAGTTAFPRTTAFPTTTAITRTTAPQSPPEPGTDQFGRTEARGIEQSTSVWARLRLSGAVHDGPDRQHGRTRRVRRCERALELHRERGPYADRWHAMGRDDRRRHDHRLGAASRTTSARCTAQVCVCRPSASRFAVRSPSSFADLSSVVGPVVAIVAYVALVKVRYPRHVQSS